MSLVAIFEAKVDPHWIALVVLFRRCESTCRRNAQSAQPKSICGSALRPTEQESGAPPCSRRQARSIRRVELPILGGSSPIWKLA